MPILGLQRALHERGRIRIGEQVPTKSGKTRPAKLATFRLTSRDLKAIEAVASIYGGTPQKWAGPDGSHQWEVYTAVDELPVKLPPAELSFSQYFELWEAGGCLRRCDGQTELLSDSPCMCNPDPGQRECDYHTRLSLILREVPGLGVWRLDTQGFYAARELLGSVSVLNATAASNDMLPARLRLEQRSIKRQGEPRRDFAVPVLDIDVTFDRLEGILASGPSGQPLPALSVPEDERPGELAQPVPTATVWAPQAPEPQGGALVDVAPAPTAQSKPTAAKVTSRGKRKPPELPATGRKPRTHDELPRHPITNEQMARLQATLRECGIHERAERLRLATKIVGREIATANELTTDEAAKFIEALLPLRTMYQAFTRHRCIGVDDQLIVLQQLVPRADLDNVNDVTEDEANTVMVALNGLDVAEGEKFGELLTRLAQYSIAQENAEQAAYDAELEQATGTVTDILDAEVIEGPK